MGIRIGISVNRLTRIFLTIWTFSIVAFLALLYSANNSGVPGNLRVMGTLTSVFFGVLAFIAAVATTVYSHFIQKYRKALGYNLLKRLFLFLVYFLFLPFSLIVEFLASTPLLPRRYNQETPPVNQPSTLISTSARAAKALLVYFLVILPLWAGGYAFLYFGISYLSGNTSTPIEVVGQSMVPTFQNHDWPKMFPKLPYSKISLGDIVVFSNGATFKNGQAASFVKRVVAVPGDSITIRNGYLYKNNELAIEPYTNKQRSTYGGKFLEECKEITIPPDYYFVMGDNRTRSQDSRAFGLVSKKDIDSFLPYSKQQDYQTKWRDASHDLETSTLSSLNVSDYYNALNRHRTENNLKELKADTQLEKAATSVAENLIKNNEVNAEYDSRTYKTKKAISEAKSFVNSWQEVSTIGYYDSEDLLGHWLEFAETREFVESNKYAYIGVGSAYGKINGCETQVIVQILGAYVPPNYKQTDIDGWKRNLASLKEIQSGWNNLKNNSAFYQKNSADIDRINQIIAIRIANITSIVSRMEANQWFTDAEQRMVNQDAALFAEQESIATKLNSQH